MKTTAKERGEWPGCGPQWACREYGVGDHDYFTCPACKAWFDTYMAAKTNLLPCRSISPSTKAA